MREPNLDSAIGCLSAADVMEELFKNKKGAEEELAQILFFCRKENIPTFIDAITKIPEEKKKSVLNSIFNLYPMTKWVVLDLLQKHETEPADFLSIFDIDNQLIDKIKETLKEITKKSTANNLSVNEYKSKIENVDKEISDLDGKMKELEKLEDDYQKKVAQIEEKRGEVEKLKKDIQEGGLGKKIKELECEKKKLESKKKANEKRYNQLGGEIEAIQESLQNENSVGDKGYQDALKALERCVKKINKEE